MYTEVVLPSVELGFGGLSLGRKNGQSDVTMVEVASDALG